MNKCPNCGNKLNDIDVLCPKCGAVVEVVQIKSHNFSPTASVSPDTHKDESEKIYFPEDLIVYNDDLPPDSNHYTSDTGVNYSDAAQNATEISKSSGQKKNEDSIPLYQNQSGRERHYSPLDDYPEPVRSTINERRYTPSKETAEPVQPAVREKRYSPSEEPIVPSYSADNETGVDESLESRYLKMLKRLNLPELDNLSHFDPEEFTREYRQKRSAYHHIPAENVVIPSSDRSSAPVKRWLEIEEVTPLNSPDNLNRSSRMDQKLRRSTFADVVDEKSTIVKPTPRDDLNGQSDFFHYYPLAEQEETPTRQSRREYAHKKIKHKKIKPEKIKPEKTARHAKPPKIREENAEPPTLMKKPSALLIVLFWILVSCVVFVCFMFFDSFVNTAYGGYPQFIDSITNGKVDLDTQAAYQNSMNVSASETLTADGDPAHLFQVSTADGVSVNIIPLSQTLALTNGYTETVIPDYEFAKALNIVTDQNKVVTDDIVFQITTQYAQNDYQIGDLTLHLEPADYSRKFPVQSISSTVDDSVTVELSVSPDATIRVNDQDMTGDVIDSRLYIDLPLSMGENTTTIEVIETGKTTSFDIIKINRELPPVTLELNSDFLRVYGPSFSCSGFSDPGAAMTVQVDDGTAAYSTIANADGSYSVDCDVGDVGLHSVSITATADGKMDKSASMTVERVPELSAFNLDTHTLTVSDVVTDSDKLQNVYIHLTGIAKNITLDANEQLFELTEGARTLPCFYHGSEKLLPDIEYTYLGIYDAASSSFYVMYVTEP